MDFLPRENYKRILYIVLYAVLGIGTLYIFFKYILNLILPFLIAWCVALVIRPMAQILHKRTGINQKLLSALLVLLVLLFLGVFIFLLLDKLIYESRGLIEYISKNIGGWIDALVKSVGKWSEKIPFLQTFSDREQMQSVLLDITKNFMSKFTQNVPDMLRHVISVLPNTLFVSLVLIMASYYFCADYEIMLSHVKSIIPPKTFSRISEMKSKLKFAGKNVLKGYLLTMVLTFFQLYIGFLIIKTEYAFSLALVTAAVDILPVIGVGTVLVPWAIVKLMLGSYYQGFGILIIFAVVSIVREILEPKIIGKSIGLHPLMTLFSMYMGLRLCGFIGLISFPAAVIVIKTAFTKKGA